MTPSPVDTIRQVFQTYTFSQMHANKHIHSVGQTPSGAVLTKISMPGGHCLGLKYDILISIFSAVVPEVSTELGADAAREVRVQGQWQRGRAA